MLEASSPDTSPIDDPPAQSHLALAQERRDPMVLCIAIAAAFALIAGVWLTIPTVPHFDEIHYLPAARELISWSNGEGGEYLNPEHPMLGKQLLALGISIFGDSALGWRIMPLLAGTIALFASMRALWHASYDRFATIAFGVLLVTGFPLYIHARIAMLDIFMVAFLTLAAWQFAAAIREPERGRWRLIATGIAIGCALASKWNAVPMAMAFGLTFFAARLSAGRRRLFTSARGIPVPGVSLVEAAIWLGALPLAVYALTFLPGYSLGSQSQPSPLVEHGLIGLHNHILELQQSVKDPHRYQSTWSQWVLNTRGIWYLYEFVDGAQRGVLLIGNPITMLLGIPAMAWCLVMGLLRGDWAKIAVVVGYGVSLGLWLIAPKPVQFYYHYFMPSVFLLGGLALTLSDLRKAGRTWIAYGTLSASAAMFALFFPIISGAPLDGPNAFADWTWLNGWR